MLLCNAPPRTCSHTSYSLDSTHRGKMFKTEKRICTLAATGFVLEVMFWCSRPSVKGFACDTTSIAAGSHGHLEVSEYCCENWGRPRPNDRNYVFFCNTAARHGHLQVVKLCRDTVMDFDGRRRFAMVAAASGRVNENGYAWRGTACTSAARNGNIAWLD